MSRRLEGGSPGPPCPPNWRRSTTSHGKVIYTTALGHEIHNVKQLRDFLLSDVTCKCSLPCPLIIEKWFDFSTGSISDDSPAQARKNDRQKNFFNNKNQKINVRTSSKVIHKPKKRRCDGLMVSQLLAAKEKEDHTSSQALDANFVVQRNTSEIEADDSAQMPRETSPVGNDTCEQLDEKPTIQTELQPTIESNEKLPTQSLLVATVDSAQLYQPSPLQVYCSPNAPQQLILNSAAVPNVHSPLLTTHPSQSELILNNSAQMNATVDLNTTVNNIGGSQGLLSTSPLFPYSLSSTSFVLGALSSVGIMGLDSTQLQRLPTTLTQAVTAQEITPQTQVTAGPTLVAMAPYNMAPVSVEHLSCGILQTAGGVQATAGTSLDGSGGGHASGSVQGPIQTADTATANGAGLLSPSATSSVCQILPIAAPILSADATTRDSNDNALLYNVTTLGDGVLIQPQRCNAGK